MALTPYRLRAEYQAAPALALQTATPRLSWSLRSDARSDTQTAYQIQAGTTAGASDLWDSGKVASAAALVTYAGTVLTARKYVFWRVRVWDGADVASGYLASTLGVGLLAAGDWQSALAISLQTGQTNSDTVANPSALLRRAFTTTAGKTILRARLYATARGFYIPSLNGEPLAPRDVHLPGWTDYAVRLPYQCFDVTALVRSGGAANALGIELAEGLAAGQVLGERGFYVLNPDALCCLTVEYTDGTSQHVISDASWKAFPGPATQSLWFAGEEHDGRKELPGWDRPGYPDAVWYNVTTAAFPAGVARVAAVSPPVRRIAEVAPVSVTEPDAGLFVADFGKNLPGWTRLALPGSVTGTRAGTVISLRHAETVTPTGTTGYTPGSLYPITMTAAFSRDKYTIRGDASGETWEPRFLVHGFRFVEVSGLPAGTTTAQVKSYLTAIVAHAEEAVDGTFDCSDSLLNRIWDNTRRSQDMAAQLIFQEGLARAERMQWNCDNSPGMEIGAWYRDRAASLAKITTDVLDSQRPANAATDANAFPNYSPFIPHSNANDVPAAGWGDDGVILPWLAYLRYKDTAMLSAAYAGMKRWILWYQSKDGDNNQLVDYCAFGDYLPVGSSCTSALISTAFYAYSVGLIVNIAGVLGQTADVTAYTTQRDAIRAAFRTAYISTATKSTGTQGGDILALAFDLVATADRAAMAAALRTSLQTQSTMITFGFLGIRFFARVLSRDGLDDLAYLFLRRTTYPSFGWQINQDSPATNVYGATTHWERWDAQSPNGTFAAPGQNSLGHAHNAVVAEYLFHGVAGIRGPVFDPLASTASAGAGFAAFTIKPALGGGLDRGRATYESVRGLIVSDWRILSGKIVLTVAVPPGATATIYLPTTDAVSAREGGLTLALAPGVTSGAAVAGFAVCTVGAGSYSFTATQGIVT